MRVLVAPDSFKGSLGAAAVAAALAEGWLSVRPGDQVTRLPLADGGEGTLDVLAATVPGARWHRARVTGPAGAPVTCSWLELPAESPGRGDAARPQAGPAVVELARASGLPLLARPDPMGAQTTGLGELLGRALDAGVGRILVGLGGSASTDGGTGALAALGARFLDAVGNPLPPGGGALADLARADLSGLRAPPGGGVTCLTDVSAPLLGPRGAAVVFGPQKGADGAQIARLEAGLGRARRGARRGSGRAGGRGRGRDWLWAGGRLGRNSYPGGGGTVPAGGAGPGAGRCRSGHHGGGAVRRDLADREDVRDRGRRCRSSGGAGGSSGRPGERRSCGAATGRRPNARRGPGPDCHNHPGWAGGRDGGCAGWAAAVAAAGGRAASQRCRGGKFPGLAGDLPGMSNLPGSGRTGDRSRHGSR